MPLRRESISSSPRMALTFNYLLVLSLLTSVAGNILTGSPHVVCNEEGVIFEMETNEPFTGQLYVRNEFHNEKCRANFESARGRSYLKGGSFKLKFNDCGMRRQRVATPVKGMAYTVTMMIQFHKTFVTDTDKAYHIRCFYREQTLTITSGQMDVSPLATDMMHIDHPMPKCSYTIRHNGVNGPIATFARIGDPVVHAFYCENDYDTYSMLVRECFVDDGKEHVQKLISADGCGVDENLFTTPEYSGTGLEAFSQAKVFKWPDETSVYFSCQITLCMKDDAECQLKSPPRCGLPRFRFKRSTNESSEEEITTLESEAEGISFDLEVRRLIVLDFEDGIDSSIYSQMAKNTVNKEKVVPISQNFLQQTNATTEPPAIETTFRTPEPRQTTTETTLPIPQTTGVTSSSTSTTPRTTSTSTAKTTTTKAQTVANRPTTRTPLTAVPMQPKKVSQNVDTSPFDGAEPLATSGPNGRRCFGAEYVIGFAIMLTVFCLILGVITVRLCYPYAMDKWKERTRKEETTDHSFTNPNLAMPQMCAAYSFYPY